MNYSIKVGCPESEVNREFMQGMSDRMALSYHKYGVLANNYPHHADAIESLKKRLRMYAETGNTEWLIDVANFAMIEFTRPSKLDAHFRPTDSDESPGVKSAYGDRYVHGRLNEPR